MVQIITDTLACLPQEIADLYHIPVIPQIINFGDESFYEGVEMDSDQFMQRLRTSPQLPKTAAPPPELFRKEFERLVPLGETILCIHPSAEISGTVRSATVAAQEFPNADIRVVDTRVIARPLGIMVQVAAEMASQGHGADEICAELDSLIRRCRLYFLVATLEYLQRGGRIGGASALLGSMLQIKPILTLRDGKVEPFERERTYRRAIQRLKEIVLEQMPLDGSGSLCILHADALEDAQSLVESLRPLVNQADVSISYVPPAIITHGGPGILGVGFFTSK